MRKYCVLLLTALMLTGCAAEETFETIADDLSVSAAAVQPGSVQVELPGEEEFPVVENDQGRIYLCENYEIMLQTLPGGDVSQTIRSVSGRTEAEMMVMETFSDGVSRYEFVWAAAGETGDRVGRAVILDDGAYHYCLCALWDAASPATSQIGWDQVFSSFSLA